MDFAADAGIYECDKRGTGIKKSISQKPLKEQKICGRKQLPWIFFLSTRIWFEKQQIL